MSKISLGQFFRCYNVITKSAKFTNRKLLIPNTARVNLISPVHCRQINTVDLSTSKNHNKENSKRGNRTIKAILALSILQWLGFEKDDEEKETELIMTLKRAVLCTQREEYTKAEQMLHLALRMAQQQQNQQGVLYCYDLMANLAMDTFQLEKAEKLFVTVMQMLLGTGTEEDDIKMIHISLKLARIAHLLAQEEKAELGYNWCLEKIKKKQNKNPECRILYGVIEDWYAQFLLDGGKVKEATVHLEEAYKICCQVQGQHSEKCMLLLNDLGITSWRAGEISKAEMFLTEAESTGRKLDDQSHYGVVKANLGLIYLQNGLLDKAGQSCKDAFKIGKKYDNTESIEQAKYCLEQIKMAMKNE